MSKKLLYIGVIAGGIALLLKKQGERFVENLNYKIRSVKFVSADKLRLVIHVRNDNVNVPLFIQGISGFVVFRGVAVAAFQRNQTISIPPGASEDVEIMVMLNYNGIANNFLDILSNFAQNAAYTIQAELDLGPVNIPISKEFTILETI